MPLPDGWADVVTCAYLLQLLDPAARAAVLAEARRLLAPRPASRLVVVTTWADGPLVRGALGLLGRARRAPAGACARSTPAPTSPAPASRSRAA